MRYEDHHVWWARPRLEHAEAAAVSTAGARPGVRACRGFSVRTKRVEQASGATSVTGRAEGYGSVFNFLAMLGWSPGSIESLPPADCRVRRIGGNAVFVGKLIRSASSISQLAPDGLAPGQACSRTGPVGDGFRRSHAWFFGVELLPARERSMISRMGRAFFGAVEADEAAIKTRQ